MEADWEIEVAPDAPVIDAAWAGFVDLREMPERVGAIGETADFPALAEMLLRLNQRGGPVWTAKCDVWEPEAFDADELEAAAEDAQCAVACYVDLLPAAETAWGTLDEVTDWARRVSTELRNVPLCRCRVDLVIRRAFLTAEQTGLGVTVYVTACGKTEADPQGSLAGALRVFADAVTGPEPAGWVRQKLQ